MFKNNVIKIVTERLHKPSSSTGEFSQPCCTAAFISWVDLGKSLLSEPQVRGLKTGGLYLVLPQIPSALTLYSVSDSLVPSTSFPREAIQSLLLFLSDEGKALSCFLRSCTKAGNERGKAGTCFSLSSSACLHEAPFQSPVLSVRHQTVCRVQPAIHLL